MKTPIASASTAGNKFEKQPDAPTLQRKLSLTLVVLYGLGVTVGAGIYVLIGATADKAGMFAPSAFVLAAFVMVFSAATFAEMSTRFPVSAGEAVYVDKGFGRKWLTLLTGGLVILSAVVAAATITLGSAGYILELFPLPIKFVVTGIVISMALIAAWGIMESVLFAALLTVVEILGLIAVVVLGIWNDPGIVARLPEVVPSFTDITGLSIVFSASLIAFFAFIGFDDVVNLAEETRNPAKVMPWAIFLTLVAVTLIYFSVVAVAVLSLPIDELAASRAPISLLFERLTNTSPVVITLVAVAATVNGIVIQMIMASRVLYGMGRQGSLPKIFARVNPLTRTPVFSTLAIAAVVLVLALYFPLTNLAEATTYAILVVFLLVNLALVKLKISKHIAAPKNAFIVPIWIPVFGAITCFIMLTGPFFVGG